MDSEIALKKAPKIFKEDCRIDWMLPGERVYNLIRGLSPFPGAFTFLEKEGGGRLQCKIFSSTFEAGAPGEKAGTIKSDGKRELEVALTDGVLHIHSIQLEGKRRMNIKDFLAGFSLRSGVYRFS